MGGADRRCERAGGTGPSGEDGRFGGCRKMGFWGGGGAYCGNDISNALRRPISRTMATFPVANSFLDSCYEFRSLPTKVTGSDSGDPVICVTT